MLILALLCAATSVHAQFSFVVRTNEFGGSTYVADGWDDPGGQGSFGQAVALGSTGPHQDSGSHMATGGEGSTATATASIQPDGGYDAGNNRWNWQATGSASTSVAVVPTDAGDVNWGANGQAGANASMELKFDLASEHKLLVGFTPNGEPDGSHLALYQGFSLVAFWKHDVIVDTTLAAGSYTLTVEASPYSYGGWEDEIWGGASTIGFDASSTARSSWWAWRSARPRARSCGCRC